MSLLPILLVLAGSSVAAELRGEISAGIFPAHIFQASPYRSTSYYDLVYLSQVGQTLVEQNEVADIIPGIATSWEISADRRVYRFKIREGLVFHDGTALRLTDVIYSINQAMYSPGNAAHYYLSGVEGYEEGKRLMRCAGVRGLPDGRLEIRMKRPYTPLLRTLTSGAMVVGKAPDGKSSSAFVGTGPYRLVRQGEDAFLEAFDRYKGPYPPKVKKVRLVRDTDVLTGKTKLESAQRPDFLIMYLADQMGELDAREFRIVRKPAAITSGFYINQKSPNLRDKSARIELLAALDRALREARTRRSGYPLEDVYPRGMLGHRAERRSYKALASAMRAASGKPALTELTIGIFSPIANSNQDFARLFEKDTGVRVSFLQLTHNDLMQKLSDTKADVFFLRWKSVFLDPETNLTLFQFVSAFELNSRRDQFKALHDKATATVLDTERAEAYGQIADMVFEEALYLPFEQRDDFQAIRKTLRFSDFLYRHSPMFSELEIDDGG